MAKWMDLRHTYNLKGKLLLSCLGVVCIALGTTVCRVGNVGVDPFTAMNLGFSARVGMDFGTFQLLVNLAILAAVFALDKYQIGLGTLINIGGRRLPSSSCSRGCSAFCRSSKAWSAQAFIWPSARCCSRWACRCT